MQMEAVVDSKCQLQSQQQEQFRILRLTLLDLTNKNKDHMGGARNTCWDIKVKYYLEHEGGDGDNINIDLKLMGWKCMDRIYLAQYIPQ